MKNGLTWHKGGKQEACVVIEIVQGHQMRSQPPWVCEDGESDIIIRTS